MSPKATSITHFHDNVTRLRIGYSLVFGQVEIGLNIVVCNRGFSMT